MIRRAVQDDIPELARIFLEDLRETYADILPAEYFETKTLHTAQKTWSAFLSQTENRCFVWQQDGKIAGFAGVRPAEENSADRELSALYIDRNSQGQGIGKKMILSILKQARDGGASAVYISVVLQNGRAKGVYEHLGAKFCREFTYCFDSYPVLCGRYIWNISDFSDDSNRKAGE